MADIGAGKGRTTPRHGEGPVPLTTRTPEKAHVAARTADPGTWNMIPVMHTERPMKRFLPVALVVAGLSTVALPSAAASFAEQRGFEACAKALEEEMRGSGLVLERTYKRDESGAGRVFEIAGTAWIDGQRTRVTMQCDTSSNGRRVVASNTDFGETRSVASASN